MNPNSAQRVKELVEELSNTRIGDLNDTKQLQSMLQELHQRVGEVQAFAEATSSLLGHFAGAAPRRGPGRPPKSASSMPVARKTVTRTRRGGGRPGAFASTPFILQTVQESGRSGIKAGEIVQKVQMAAPGHHAKPSALVSTILTRLKKRGEVRRKSGKWYPTAA